MIFKYISPETLMWVLLYGDFFRYESINIYQTEVHV